MCGPSPRFLVAFSEVQGPLSVSIPIHSPQLRPPAPLACPPLAPYPTLSPLCTLRTAFYLKHNQIMQIPCPSHSPGSASPSFFIPTCTRS